MQIKRRRNKVSKFIPNLHKILSDNDSGANWREDGKSFVLSDISKLISNSLTKYFRHSNISSFIRQLNLYGFKKIVGEEVQENTYFHEKFKKNYITQLKPMRSYYNQQKYGKAKKPKKSHTDQINVQSIQSNEQPECFGKTDGFSVPIMDLTYKQKITILEKENQRLKAIEQDHLHLLNCLNMAHQQSNLNHIYDSHSTNNLFNFLSQSKNSSQNCSQLVQNHTFNLQSQVQNLDQFFSNYQSTYYLPFPTNL